MEIYIQKVLLMKKGKQLARPEAMTKVKTQPRGLRRRTKTKKSFMWKCYGEALSTVNFPLVSQKSGTVHS